MKVFAALLEEARPAALPGLIEPQLQQKGERWGLFLDALKRSETLLQDLSKFTFILDDAATEPERWILV